MTEMVESIMLHGVLVPGLVRTKPDGGYEMVAGHRRKMASRLAGKTDMDCIVRELTDEEAIIIMVDSNLQREQLLERARSNDRGRLKYAALFTYPKKGAYLLHILCSFPAVLFLFC